MNSMKKSSNALTKHGTMGCDCCNKWSVEADKCTASLKYRTGFCDQVFPWERKKGRTGSNYTPPKKKRRK